MNFLDDLDSLTIALTVGTILLNLIYLFFMWRAREDGSPVKLGRQFGIPIALLVFCLFAAYDAYCPDADQPHIRIAGPVTPLGSYTYYTNKSKHHGLLACVNDCSHGAPTLEFSESATARLVHSGSLQFLTVVYLGRAEAVEANGTNNWVAHPVVEITDPASGTQLFYKDTTRHWPRVLVLLADALIGILAFLLFVRMSRSDSDQDEGDSSDSQSASSMPNELTGLGLGSEDH